LGLTSSLQTARVGFVESLHARRQLQRAGRQLAPRPLWEAALPANKDRTIYTASNTQRLPGQVVRGEGDPPATGSQGLAVNEAYDYFGQTYDFYSTVFQRDSIDDKGLRLDGTVHFGHNYDNAYWDGRRMVFGDGDQQLFDRFTKSVDVIGHELTHGITQNEAGLIFLGSERGAQ